jgi:ribosomal RNA-processing protein 17
MMNVRPRPQPSLLSSGPPPKKRKTAALAEITFDPAAREEYLTGFHKRKEERKKHAQAENAKRAYEEKLKFRREVCHIFVDCVVFGHTNVRKWRQRGRE